MSYGKIAVIATDKIVLNRNSPSDAWNKAAVENFAAGSASTLKACPKNAFLGLCEAGLVKGVKAERYTRSDWNKKYALKAVELLKTYQKVCTPSQLWKDVLNHLDLNQNKAHNSQMHVVLALWNEGYII